MESVTHSQVFKEQYLSIEEVEKRAPSIFTSLVSSKVSSKYKTVSTPDVLENLATIGWKPVDAYQVTPKKAENLGFQKHFVKLRNDNYFVGSKNDISIIPELLLINSYDAKCSFKFYISLYRTISKSSIVMKTDLLLDEYGREKMKLPHKGEKSKDYSTLRDSFDENVRTVIDLMNNMSKVNLDTVQQKSFAKECCRARWDYTYNLLQPKSLLDPWRDEDESNDLLTMSYRIQEKLVKGGWIGAGGVTIKAIKDPNREFNINSRLFQIIEHYYLQLKK